jgi:ribonucleoside-diphosphate reductase alpha chain
MEMSAFASTVMHERYSHDLESGEKETWANIAHRVVTPVLKSVGASKSQIERTEKLVLARKFIPGGRYLFATGRPFHQVNNCVLLRADDSREGWAESMQRSTMALMTGAGIGLDYSNLRGKGKVIRKTGGFASGPIALMQMINEAGRFIRQGGTRRSAIWAGLKWSHPDIQELITIKNWSPEVRSLKARDFNFPAPMDGTNVSVLLDDQFFAAY